MTKNEYLVQNEGKYCIRGVIRMRKLIFLGVLFGLILSCSTTTYITKNQLASKRYHEQKDPEFEIEYVVAPENAGSVFQTDVTIFGSNYLHEQKDKKAAEEDRKPNHMKPIIYVNIYCYHYNTTKENTSSKNYTYILTNANGKEILRSGENNEIPKKQKEYRKGASYYQSSNMIFIGGIGGKNLVFPLTLQLIGDGVYTEVKIIKKEK